MATEKPGNQDTPPERTLGEKGAMNPAPLPPSGFAEEARASYQALQAPELSFEQFLDVAMNEFHRLHPSGIAANTLLPFPPQLGAMTPCGNGDLETFIDPAEWEGGYGTIQSGTGNLNFAGLTSGLFPGPYNMGTQGNQATQAHQTWVANLPDPIAPISQTAPGSSGAARIGNALVSFGCELLRKTFIVSPANQTITFWYAAVLQDPGHGPNQNPYFWVRVTDASGVIVPGAFDFGLGSDRLVADSNNPFFQNLQSPQYGRVVYRDWSCAQIDLTSQVGKQVTIEFVTVDCAQGGHFGYAYIDKLCGGCAGSPDGNLSYNCEGSTHCGDGKLCFDYSLPLGKDPAGNPIPIGSLVITVDIYQNGALLTTLTSPSLTSGTAFCFPISPSAIPGINLLLGGFDWTAKGVFTVGLWHKTIKIGAAPDGQNAGRNNDYLIACKSCEEIAKAQNALLARQCGKKVNVLPRQNCDCGGISSGACDCKCSPLALPKIEPCISVAWGDSKCDCLETNDLEVLCVKVCNCYSNITFTNMTIGQIRVTELDGTPVPVLPDGTPSIQVIPSGPICFGAVGPCTAGGGPNCVSRELAVYTRGAVGRDYRLSFEGVCFEVVLHQQSKECFVLKLCQD